MHAVHQYLTTNCHRSLEASRGSLQSVFGVIEQPCRANERLYRDHRPRHCPVFSSVMVGNGEIFTGSAQLMMTISDWRTEIIAEANWRTLTPIGQQLGHSLTRKQEVGQMSRHFGFTHKTWHSIGTGSTRSVLMERELMEPSTARSYIFIE